MLQNAQRGFYGGGAGGLTPGLPTGGGGSPGGGFAGRAPGGALLPSSVSGGSGGSAGYTVYRNDLERSLAKGFAQARQSPGPTPASSPLNSEYIALQRSQAQTMANIAASIQRRPAEVRLLPAGPSPSTPVHTLTNRPVETRQNVRGQPIYYIQDDRGKLRRVRRGDVSLPRHEPTSRPVRTTTDSLGRPLHYIRDDGGKLRRVRGADLSFQERLGIRNQLRFEQEGFTQAPIRVSRRLGAEAQIDLRQRRTYSAPENRQISIRGRTLADDIRRERNLLRREAEELAFNREHAQRVLESFRRAHQLSPGSSDFRAEVANIERLIQTCLLYTSPSPRDRQKSRMPSSA